MSVRITFFPLLTILTLVHLISFASNAASVGHAKGKIAFTSDRDGNLEIYAINADGSGEERLTDDLGIDDHPTWSPDGTKIAFVGQRSTGEFSIFLMNADGSDRTEVTPIDFSGSLYPWHAKWSVTWSPDGTHIAFSEYGDIFTINVDGSGRTNITNSPDFDDGEPSWSPDGSKIVFVSSRVFYLTLHTINPDGTGLEPWPSAYPWEWDMTPTWSPTGDRITFVRHSDDVRLPEIYSAAPDGTDQALIVGCNGANLCSEHPNKPRWSPDGRIIVFHKWEYFSNDADIYINYLDDNVYAQLTKVGRNFNPSWQPILIEVTISGRVTSSDGRVLRNALVSAVDSSGALRTTRTSSLGFYTIEGVSAAERYTISVASKRYRFAAQTLDISQNGAKVDFVGLE